MAAHVGQSTQSAKGLFDQIKDLAASVSTASGAKGGQSPKGAAEGSGEAPDQGDLEFLLRRFPHRFLQLRHEIRMDMDAQTASLLHEGAEFGQDSKGLLLLQFE